MLTLIALLAALLQQGPQAGTIEGTVVRAGTDFPIAGAEIQATTDRDSFDTVTDGAGRFVLRGVPAGRVVFQVRADGYLFLQPLPAEATVRVAGDAGYRTAAGYVLPNAELRFTVNLAPGENLKLPARPAIRASAISGRVLDAEGNGIPGAFVSLTTAITDGTDRGRLLIEMGTAVTGEQGEYRRDMLSAGDYSVKATVNRADGATVTVYYPATTDARAAALVVLPEGAEATADVQIPANYEAHTFKISGRVLPVPGKSTVNSAELLLRTQGLPPVVAANASAEEKTGRFELRGVPPGVYDLFASANIENREYLTRVPVEIRDRDVDDVEIALQPGAEVRGRLMIEDDLDDLQPARADARTVRITLNRKDGLFGDILKPVIDQTGTAFAFPDVPPGSYDIRVRFVDGSGRVPGPDLYVADIRAGGRSVFDNGFEVGIDPTDALEVIVGTHGGTITGTVAGLTSKQPAIIILAPESSRRGNSSLFAAVAADAEGQFELRRLTPGTYKIFAVPSGTLLSARAEVMAQYESRAVTVVVRKGVPLSGVQVPMLPPGR